MIILFFIETIYLFQHDFENVHSYKKQTAHFKTYGEKNMENKKEK